MLRIAGVLLMCVTCSVNAADMSVDQAVSRLLKDIQQEVEVLKFPFRQRRRSTQRGKLANLVGRS